MANIRTVIDFKRGCGWRKPGGLYMMCSGIGASCGKLPIPLTVCPCCNAGIKPSRGWTWFSPRPFTDSVPCSKSSSQCGSCVLSNPPQKAGLVWIGEKFYASPEEWIREARSLGVSRRVSAIPKDFQVGSTWVFSAHRKALTSLSLEGKEIGMPGIFFVWKPDRIEYVVTGKETEKELEELIKRGIQPVRIQRGDELPLEFKTEKPVDISSKSE